MSAKDVLSKHSIGVIHRNRKCFIVNCNFEDPKFYLTTLDGINDGNAFYIPADSERSVYHDRNEMILVLLKEGHEVLAFETPQELFKWLSEHISSK
jgi:hypothetical protein